MRDWCAAIEVAVGAPERSMKISRSEGAPPPDPDRGAWQRPDPDRGDRHYLTTRSFGRPPVSSGLGVAGGGASPSSWNSIP